MVSSLVFLIIHQVATDTLETNESVCFPSVQDLVEDSKTAGDPSQSEDVEDDNTSLSDPSEEQMMGLVEAVEGKQEAVAAKPQRRASTPPPPSLPVKLLTRLGSLEGEFTSTNIS